MTASNDDDKIKRETDQKTRSREGSSEETEGGGSVRKPRRGRRRNRKRKPDDKEGKGISSKSGDQQNPDKDGGKSDGVRRGRRKKGGGRSDGERGGREDGKPARGSAAGGTRDRRRGKRGSGSGSGDENKRRRFKGRRRDVAMGREGKDPDKESGFFLPVDDVPMDDEKLSDILMDVIEDGETDGFGGHDAPENVWKRECVRNVSRVHVQGEVATEEADCGDLFLQRGDHIVVETDRGQAMARVLTPSVRKVLMDPRLRSVLRRFDAGDMRQEARNRRRAREAYGVGKERIVSRNIKMKLVGVDYLHSGNKAVFYFTADGRVDFRELIRDLARNLRVRIEMRQIGIRDEARLVGGMGTCGRELCCNTFLEKFDQISIRMAKDQKIVLNPQKISGQCGRLKCCLVYEHHIYREMGKGLPRVGKRIETPKGEGRIADVDVLTRRIRVDLDDGAMEVFSADELGISATRGVQDSESETRGDD